MATRRELKFESLADVVRDAENLLARGYDKTGNWDLAQCCGHLRNWMSYQIDGFPRTPLFLRPAFWVFRNTIAPRLFRNAVASETTKPGMPTIPESVPPDGQDATQAVEELRKAVERWEGYNGPLHPSPLFGSVTKDAWTKAHLMHAALHLSFLVPKGSNN